MGKLVTAGFMKEKTQRVLSQIIQLRIGNEDFNEYLQKWRVPVIITSISMVNTRP